MSRTFCQHVFVEVGARATKESRHDTLYPLAQVNCNWTKCLPVTKESEGGPAMLSKGEPMTNHRNAFQRTHPPSRSEIKFTTMISLQESLRLLDQAPERFRSNAMLPFIELLETGGSLCKAILLWEILIDPDSGNAASPINILSTHMICSWQHLVYVIGSLIEGILWKLPHTWPKSSFQTGFTSCCAWLEIICRWTCNQRTIHALTAQQIEDAKLELSLENLTKIE